MRHRTERGNVLSPLFSSLFLLPGGRFLVPDSRETGGRRHCAATVREDGGGGGGSGGGRGGRGRRVAMGAGAVEAALERPRVRGRRADALGRGAVAVGVAVGGGRGRPAPPHVLRRRRGRAGGRGAVVVAVEPALLRRRVHVVGRHEPRPPRFPAPASPAFIRTDGGSNQTQGLSSKSTEFLQKKKINCTQDFSWMGK